MAPLTPPTHCPPQTVLSRFDYPLGFNDSLQALSAGALCAAAALLLSAAGAQHAPAARGGATLGVVAAAAVWGATSLLCALTPYCWA